MMPYHKNDPPPPNGGILSRFNESLRAWWPIALTVVLVVVWFSRLETKVLLNNYSISANQARIETSIGAAREAAREYERTHEKWAAEVFKRLEDRLVRIEDKIDKQ